MDHTVGLTLAEELALIALGDHDGKPILNETVFQIGLAGAMLAEMAILGRIDLSGDRVTVTDTTPTGDPQIDALLDRIAQEAKPRKVQWWVEKIKSSALQKGTLERLAARGVVSESEHRVLGILPIRRYPQADPDPETQIRSRIRAVLGGGAADQRTAALIALIDACGMTRRQFPEASKGRIKRIIESDQAGRSVKKVIQSIHLATAASIAVIGAAGAASAG
ncbi:GOLPH3/VPS74 family protein [Marinactinospora thermotolerans]|uniref:Golgi phosphoprotein 3 (GPP34) n=1 Tax=Marinactinospora thermotolerans DSM 45154 TaxID=1122192 RepID=A0A1T4T3P0_9ACTN|nr:GPP34 family phosphoprotein [Marinactinospora thermotolerans]SKA34768.1 Golgi phosphoprotein 3 (GPP34) [Marinactinospora thermotolerans DSM 45154]